MLCPQLVMLGSGHPPYEAAMREQEERHPHHFRGWVGFSIPVAHRIIAGKALGTQTLFWAAPCGLHHPACSSIPLRPPGVLLVMQRQHFALLFCERIKITDQGRALDTSRVEKRETRNGDDCACLCRLRHNAGALAL